MSSERWCAPSRDRRGLFPGAPVFRVRVCSRAWGLQLQVSPAAGRGGRPGCLRLLSCLRPGAWPPEARRASGSALRVSVLARPRPSFGTKECFAETFPAVGREAAGPAGGPTNSRELVASGAPGSFSLLSRVNRSADEQGCQTVCGPVPVCGRGRTWRKMAERTGPRVSLSEGARGAGRPSAARRSPTACATGPGRCAPGPAEPRQVHVLT